MYFSRLLLLGWLPASIYALTPATVAELAEIIHSKPAQDADKKIARELADIYLVERLTDDTLARMIRHAPGPWTQTALQDLAADSAFLDTPINELPHRDRPPLAEQKAMLSRAVSYASGFVRTLPDFICTIETRLLDDDTHGGSGTDGKSERFHLRNVEVSGLTFEAGKESYAIQSINGKKPRDSKPLRGLTTWGEFGPQMALLFLPDSDASFLWSHWETFDGKQLAVLSYSVDAAHSHYSVSWCCGSIPGPDGKYPPVSSNVAYTGQIFVDPDSGSVLRLTRQTVAVPIESHIDLIRTVVEYKPVEIGGALYICPFRSVSVAHETRNRGTAHVLSLETITNLNEIHFTGYRKFEAESRILTESPPPDSEPAPTVPVDAAVPMEQPMPELPLVEAPMPDKLDLVEAPANPVPAVITQPRESPVPTFGTTVVISGALQGEIYYIPPGTPRLPKFDRIAPVGAIYTDSLNIPPRDFKEGFPGVTSRFEWFAIDYRGRFWIEKPGKYQFELMSDDGSILYVDDRVLIDNDGLHPPKTRANAITLSAGIHRIRVSYFRGPRLQVALVLSVKGPGGRRRPFSTREFSPPSNQ